MRFAEAWWLAGTAVALAVALLLIGGGLLHLRALSRFGDEERMAGLVTGKTGSRRTVKGVLLVLAVAFGFIALAQPQAGRGTRLVPATNLDVVITLDYSKSMFARDVAPSRIARATAEVARLISELPGARFAAVAFAGEPISFPLTSDGGAIAQFFRQLSPNDMPVGGTAIARALDKARSLLRRDPKSKDHKKVIVLVTDGEDLQGDPVSLAQAAAAHGITIDVVQVGGDAPVRIPDVNLAGQVTGWRKDRKGQPLTTSISRRGQDQLAAIAEATGGVLVHGGSGETGINKVAQTLRQMMTGELAERVETVYADIFYYPAGLAVLLLIAEAFIAQTRRRRPLPTETKARGTQRAKRAKHAERSGGAATRLPRDSAAVLLLLSTCLSCETAIDRVFERYSPTVDQAIHQLDAGDTAAATQLLADYLATGVCDAGSSITIDDADRRFNAGLDLGLALFKQGEQQGPPFGEETDPNTGKLLPPTPERVAQIECGLSALAPLTGDDDIPISVRARAAYLAGNLEFLRGQYPIAVEYYDDSIRMSPGFLGDAGDPVGGHAAWNRAIALSRIEESQEDGGGGDGGENDQPDGGPEQQPSDAGSDGGEPEDNKQDAGDEKENEDQGDQKDQKGDNPDEAPPESEGANEPPDTQAVPTTVVQDERMLDELERAPSLEVHKRRKLAGTKKRTGGMEDK